MNNPLYRMFVGSVIRHGLVALSAYLVSKHLLTPDHQAGFVENLTAYVADAAPVILATGWSFIQKYEQHEATK